ncbi:MAG TPA: response regulator transcription factor [Candidatus Angelobacter sp.]|nr:response regulator transcription factor [Candidatus Angelobacter sp.]
MNTIPGRPSNITPRVITKRHTVKRSTAHPVTSNPAERSSSRNKRPMNVEPDGELQTLPPACPTLDEKSLTILVADDHPLVREGLVAVIHRQTDMRVVAEATNGREAAEKFLAEQPDIGLLDLRMPVMDGVEAAATICEQRPEAGVVIVSSYQSEEEVYRAMRAGAKGYILKDAPVQDLIDCIHALAQGKTWIPPAVGAKLARRVTGQELTPREMQVLRAMAAGKSNKEIGVLLDIAESTVKVHVTHLLEKLKAGGRTEAIGIAVKRGLVAMDSAQT